MGSTTLYQSTSTKLSGPETENCYALPGRERRVVIAPTMTITISAQGAVPSPIEPRAALELRKCNSTTPYKADNWDRILRATGLLPHFIKVSEGI
jgi:hypothetical protein